MEHEQFALKGGTALNLFYRSLPRLSVDIDLCYLPIEDRETTFKNIHDALQRSKSNIEHDLKCRVLPTNPLNGTRESKLLVERDKIQIKIEPNYTIRGSLFSPEQRPISPSAKERFGAELECKCLDFADLMGGKLCAALDRQHPRDLFDIWHFLNHETWNRKVVDSFIFYLISHNRPIQKLLNPNFRPIEKSFVDEFNGMTDQVINIEVLEEAREQLATKIGQLWNKSDKEFLLSILMGTPNWQLFREPSVGDFPSIKWKMLNINKMDAKKRSEQTSLLEKTFS